MVQMKLPMTAYIKSLPAANQLTLYVYYMDTHLYTYSQAAFLNSH